MTLACWNFCACYPLLQHIRQQIGVSNPIQQCSSPLGVPACSHLLSTLGPNQLLQMRHVFKTEPILRHEAHNVNKAGILTVMRDKTLQFCCSQSSHACIQYISRDARRWQEALTSFQSPDRLASHRGQPYPCMTSCQGAVVKCQLTLLSYIKQLEKLEMTSVSRPQLLEHHSGRCR